MLRGYNHTRNAQTLGEIPMSTGAMTLYNFQDLEVPPSVRAPRKSLVASFMKVVLGPFIASAATTTTGVSDEQTGTFGAQQQRLSQQALTVFVGDSAYRIDKFIEALSEALELNATMVEAEEGDRIDDQTLQYAVQSLVPLIASHELPAPLILPLQNGGIGAEWHTSGMNIELRFRKPYDVYALLEDARGNTPFHGRDPDLVHIRPALRDLSRRCVE
jgi:hypothetical protein